MSYFLIDGMDKLDIIMAMKKRENATMSPLVVLVMFVDIVDRDVLEQEVPMDVDVSIKEKDTTKKGHVLKKVDARRKVDALKKACTRVVSKPSGKKANASKA